MEVSEHAIACTLTGLYLRGGPLRNPTPRSRWIEVENSLRLAACSLEGVQGTLAKAGLWFESASIAQPGVLVGAERLVQGSRVLPANDAMYPSLWRAKLGSAAPPVLWVSGRVPPGGCLAVVGSRRVEGAPLAFARRVAERAVERGLVVVSGGAEGCDRAAAKGAASASDRAGVEPRLLELLPHGVKHGRRRDHCVLSLSPPLEPFSSAAAMERNTLIYAMSQRAVVAHARLREGGTWQGASACLRRRLSCVFVRDDGSPAARALHGLGAFLAASPEDALGDPAGDRQGNLALG